VGGSAETADRQAICRDFAGRCRLHALDADRMDIPDFAASEQRKPRLNGFGVWEAFTSRVSRPRLSSLRPLAATPRARLRWGGLATATLGQAIYVRRWEDHGVGRS
jgi:hypothetical protein